MHERKSARAQIKGDKELGLSFRYESRTPNKKAKVAAMMKENVDGYTFEISSIDTGWTSGTVILKDKAMVTVPISKCGENKFVVTVYDDFGREIKLANSEIVITNTLANVSQILANHSIGLAVQKDQHSEKIEMIYLV